jgi:hypothetical protein
MSNAGKAHIQKLAQQTMPVILFQTMKKEMADYE